MSEAIALFRQTMPQLPIIAHFVRRDFASYRFYWAVLAGFIALSAVIATRSPDVWNIVAFGCLLFALAPLNSITGVVWRSQHIMSRNYLLSLPVPRRQMFALIQLRALVFWLPLFGMVGLMPYIWDIGRLDWTPTRYITLTITLLGLSLWCVNMLISTQLNWERIASYLNQRQRFKTWVTVTAVLLFECQVAAIAFLLGLSLKLGPILPVAAAWAMAVIRYRLNERRWAGT